MLLLAAQRMCECSSTCCLSFPFYLPTVYQVFSFSYFFPEVRNLHLKTHIVKLEKSCKSLSTQLSVLQPITDSSISDTTVKSTASSSNSSQTVLSNSHPFKDHPISPNPAHLNTSNVRSNPSLAPKFLNKHPHFLSQTRPPHKPPLLPTPRYHQ